MSKAYYGAIGNGEIVALISPHGAVEWLCVPHADSFPVFARALDPERGGALTLEWGLAQESIGNDPDGGAIEERLSRSYLGRTNILETNIQRGSLTLTLRDYMPWGGRSLIRQINLSNQGDRAVEIALGFTLTPTVSSVAPPRQESLLVADFKGEREAHLQPGQSLVTAFVLAYGNTPDEARANWEAAPVDGLQDEEAFWSNWLAQSHPVQSGEAELNEAYYRSLLALKLLCQERTGAILAAPTASFPAIPGGGDNWDYRFCWLRDGYFIARCFDMAGLHTESRRFYELVLKFQAPDGRWYQTLYTADGGNPVEYIAEEMQGPNGERPIRFGNAASTQLQIDSEPNVLHGLWIHWQTTGDDAFLQRCWPQIRLAAEAVQRTWKEKENGIWEIRERADHWVYGKALCAAGLKAAAEMATALGEELDAANWSNEAELIRQEVVEQGWSAERQTYLQTYDKRSPIDISVLALSLWELLPADDPRLTATIEAIEKPAHRPLPPTDDGYSTDTPYWGMQAGGLNMWGGFARYDYAAVPFYLPTLWLARHHLRAGNRDRALALARLCLASSTSLGLMAEHFDPRTGEQWGNFPQGFSHEEMALLLLELFGPEEFLGKRKG